MQIARHLQQCQEQQHVGEGRGDGNQHVDAARGFAAKPAEPIGAGHRDHQRQQGGAQTHHAAVEQVAPKGRIALQQRLVVLERPASLQGIAGERSIGAKGCVELPEHRAQAPEDQQQPVHRCPPAKRGRLSSHSSTAPPLSSSISRNAASISVAL